MCYRKAVADLNPAAVFHGIGPMNYQAFTSDSLTMMYEGIRGAYQCGITIWRRLSLRSRI